ncbi:phage tail protein [Natronomonas gomsonensis]|uniref:phage tail protein n=1 Tax=Natronomonas gomsonensis TaxID=1046043 RepID=UPI0020CA81B6|nr:phage tail protein [Natronomonas gomsonensis]MCY4732095.1 phage tail protein [Natronomonas gomsonensis]
MSGIERDDPLPKFRFRVEIDTMVVGGFSEVRGLSMSIAERKEDDADDRSFWQRLFGLGRSGELDSTKKSNDDRQFATTSPTLELRRGLTEEKALWTWYEEWLNGSGEKRNIRLILLDEHGIEARGWECRGAKPVRWVGPTLVAGESGIALETFELAHEGIWQLDGL